MYNIPPLNMNLPQTRTEGVGGQSLYLHVHIPDERRTVLVVINSDHSVSELIRFVIYLLAVRVYFCVVGSCFMDDIQHMGLGEHS